MNPTTLAQTTGQPTTHALRADAERNRERILDAAQELFAVRGIDVPLEDVAQRAGVGIATLYRRFPSRADLVAATVERTFGVYARIVEAAAGDPDPWHGFSAMVAELCTLQAANAATKDLLTLRFSECSVVGRLRQRTQHSLEVVIDRAKAQGALRADFDITDVAMLLLANAGLVAAAGDGAPNTSARFAAYLVQSFRAGARDPLPDPPTPEQLTRSTSRSRPAPHRCGARLAVPHS